MQIVRLDFRQVKTRTPQSRCILLKHDFELDVDGFQLPKPERLRGSPRYVVGTAAIAFAAGVTVGLVSTIVHAEAPAFQGHAAETQQRSDVDERRRRALYFDTVDVEIGPQGLPCDHIAASKPEATAGTGFVVLAMISGGQLMTARIWFPPDDVSRDVAKAAKSVLETRFSGAIVSVTEIQRFVWCQ